MGCSLLNMLFQLHITLLEILLIYAIKMSTWERFILTAHTPSLQMAIRLPNSSKGWAKGKVIVSGLWSGTSNGPDREFCPNRTLDSPSMKIYFIRLLSVMREINTCFPLQIRRKEAPKRVGGESLVGASQPPFWDRSYRVEVHGSSHREEFEGGYRTTFLCLCLKFFPTSPRLLLFSGSIFS